MSMFGALNRFISRLDDAPRPRSAGGEGSFGFQVLRNRDKGVALEPWFDFIVGINGRPIDIPDPNLFINEVRNLAGQSVGLTVWNAKGQRVREIYISVQSSPTPSIGLTLQWTPLSSSQQVWHILEVAPKSPADEAGLLPYGDYIIGTPEGIMNGEGGLGELVEEYLERPLQLYVYNHEYNVTRTITITPSRSWGGEGALGCVLGYGHLHQIPAPLEEGPPTAAGDTVFESATVGADARKTPPLVPQAANDDLSNFAMSPPKGDSGSYPGQDSLITPASLQKPPPMMPRDSSGAAVSKAAGRHSKKTRPGQNKGFDEMFAEGEKKSAAVDNAPTKSKIVAPPPPRAKDSTPANDTLSPESIQNSLRPETRSPDPITGESDASS